MSADSFNCYQEFFFNQNSSGCNIIPKYTFLFVYAKNVYSGITSDMNELKRLIILRVTKLESFESFGLIILKIKLV